MLLRTLGFAALLTLPVLGFGTDKAPIAVKFTMDWAWQGSQSYALVAKEKGYFEEEGIEITLDRGFGSGKVPVDLAAGTYDMGVADINPMIKFNAENPDNRVMAVAIIYEASPLVAVTKADSAIKEPKDFEGKTLAAPDFDAGRQLFPIFAKATGIDHGTINWQSVKPELREPMLARGDADAITGFVTSSLLSLKAIGVAPEDLTLFKYKDYGADLYSGAIMTTPAFAEANPDAVKGVIRAMTRGLIDTINNPDEAIEILKQFEPLTDTAIERERLQLALDEMIYTDYVKQNGLSAVDPERLQRTISAVEEAYELTPSLKVSDVYSEDYLPAREELMVK